MLVCKSSRLYDVTGHVNARPISPICDSELVVLEFMSHFKLYAILSALNFFEAKGIHLAIYFNVKSVKLLRREGPFKEHI